MCKKSTHTSMTRVVVLSGDTCLSGTIIILYSGYCTLYIRYDTQIAACIIYGIKYVHHKQNYITKEKNMYELVQHRTVNLLCTIANLYKLEQKLMLKHSPTVN